MATINIPDPIVNSIKEIVKKTKLFADEEDFVNQAIIKHISKYKEI